MIFSLFPIIYFQLFSFFSLLILLSYLFISSPFACHFEVKHTHSYQAFKPTIASQSSSLFQNGTMAGFTFYNYKPSLPAAAAFVIIFTATALVHMWQVFRHRTWYFIPFLIGCLCKYPCLQTCDSILILHS